jgi:hypothetical protein
MTVPTGADMGMSMAPAKPPLYARVGWWLWALLPILSFGLLAWVPALHGWVRLRQRWLMYWLAALAASAVLACVLMTLDPAYDNPAADSNVAGDIAAVLFVALMIAGSIHSFRLRPRMLGRSARGFHSQGSDWLSVTAVAQVERARARRVEARRVAETDPAMARELNIGRPEIPGRDLR